MRGQARHDARPRRPTATQFLRQGCMGDFTNLHSFDSQATGVMDVLGSFFDMLSMGVCTTTHWHTSGRLVQNLNICTYTVHGA